MKLKRQFQIEDGVIVTLYDTAETVTDQMLLAALNNHSSTKMKSIVTTIQRTQNRIIRNTDADLLFVQGAAGAGRRRPSCSGSLGSCTATGATSISRR